MSQGKSFRKFPMVPIERQRKDSPDKITKPAGLSRAKRMSGLIMQSTGHGRLMVEKALAILNGEARAWGQTAKGEEVETKPSMGDVRWAIEFLTARGVGKESSHLELDGEEAGPSGATMMPDHVRRQLAQLQVTDAELIEEEPEAEAVRVREDDVEPEP